jgi:hypothetical protein
MSDIKTWVIIGATFLGTSAGWFFAVWNKSEKNKVQIEKNKKMIDESKEIMDTVIKQNADLKEAIRDLTMINVFAKTHPVRKDLEAKLRAKHIVKK